MLFKIIWLHKNFYLDRESRGIHCDKYSPQKTRQHYLGKLFLNVLIKELMLKRTQVRVFQFHQ